MEYDCICSLGILGSCVSVFFCDPLRKFLNKIAENCTMKVPTRIGIKLKIGAVVTVALRLFRGLIHSLIDYYEAGQKTRLIRVTSHGAIRHNTDRVTCHLKMTSCKREFHKFLITLCFADEGVVCMDLLSARRLWCL